MARIYIYSTLTGDQLYTNYKQSPNGVAIPTAEILICGGANLMTKALVTPRGTVTEITAEDLAELRKNEVFNLHVENGFIQISESKADADIVAADMTGRDKSAPIVAEDDVIPEPASEVVEAPRRGRPRRS